MSKTIDSKSKILAVEDLSKSYPGVKALDGFCFDLFSSEIHSIVGHNGSGKSTFVKVLGGAIPYDRGKIHLGDSIQPKRFSPQDAIRNGIRVVYQDLAISPNLSVLENVFLGSELAEYGIINKGEQKQRILQLVEEFNLGFYFDIEQTARTLGFAKLQMVEIVRALIFKPRILILDEPTSALNLHEINNLLDIIRILKSTGIGIIFISHKIKEVFDVSDRITVMKNGRNVWTKNRDEVTVNDIVSGMSAGANGILKSRPGEKTREKEIALDIRGLFKKGIIRDFNCTVNKGEIVSVTGMKSESLYSLSRLILDFERPDSGVISGGSDGSVPPTISLLPEDRHKNSLFNRNSVFYNIAISSFQKYTNKLDFIDFDRIDSLSEKFIKKVNLLYKNTKDSIQTLSSGNRQKAVLVRWLVFDSDIFIIVEPTVGLDVESRFELYNIFFELVDQGKSILLISTDVQEVLYLSNTILIFKEEKIVKELKNIDLKEEDIYHYMLV